MFKHILATVALTVPMASADTGMRELGVPGIYLSTEVFDNFVRMGERVGEYEPIVLEQFSEPTNACIVDKKLSLIEQIQQCKSQRLGWMKI